MLVDSIQLSLKHPLPLGHSFSWVWETWIKLPAREAESLWGRCLGCQLLGIMARKALLKFSSLSFFAWYNSSFC